jgi:integrase/recombinase XerD
LLTSVPIVASWSMPLIPRAISPDQAQQVLSHVDRRTAVGRRDYAILLLLASLGLRAGEIVSLELGDIDWKASCLSVRGKTGRRHQLPLTKEVGDAIVGGRPPSLKSARLDQAALLSGGADPGGSFTH